MRKLLLLLAFGTAILTSKAQTVLTNETHGFIPNEQNPMILTNYVEPGKSGNNIVWDFTKLEVNNDFLGLIHDSYVSKCSSLFPQCNTVLEEFGTYFVFKSSQSSLEQYGVVTPTGQTQIVYSKPFIKMKYPFSFGSNFSGEFEGDYISNDKTIGHIKGTYSVKGDAQGKLKLPDGKEIDNAIRVKEVKSTKQTINNVTTQTEDLTYRWYVSNHRFPVLVLIKSTSTLQNGKTSSYTKAAFNSNVVNSIANNDQLNNEIRLDIYPNPYQGKVTISYNLEKTSNVNISVYDITGKLVQVVTNDYEDAGVKTHYFSASAIGMPTGVYIIKLKIDNNEISRKILEIK